MCWRVRQLASCPATPKVPAGTHSPDMLGGQPSPRRAAGGPLLGVVPNLDEGCAPGRCAHLPRAAVSPRWAPPAGRAMWTAGAVAPWPLICCRVYCFAFLGFSALFPLPQPCGGLLCYFSFLGLERIYRYGWGPMGSQVELPFEWEIHLPC